MFSSRVTCMLAAVFALLPSAVSAAVITRTYNFTASGFNSGLGSIPPYASVSGSFTVSFDSAVVTLNAAGVIINSLDIPLPATARFSYYSSDDSLAITGGDGFVDSSTRNTNDFALSIRGATSGLPTANAFNYSTVGFDDVASTRFVVLGAGSGTNAVPEPAIWAMVTIGFGLIGGALRRRPRLVLDRPSR